MNVDRTPCGSATHTPHFDESYDTPPVIRWGLDFHYLIDDIEGVIIFKKYLNSEGLEDVLDFWFACEGFKKNTEEENMTEERLKKLINIIFKKFIVKSKTIDLSEKVRSFLRDRLRPTDNKTNGLKECKNSIPLDRNIFDSAQSEVEELLKETIYPNFLRSDVYISLLPPFNNNFCDHSESEVSNRDSNETNETTNALDSTPNNFNPLTRNVLPTLPEDSELHTINNNRSNGNTNMKSLPQQRYSTNSSSDLMSPRSSDILRNRLKILSQKSSSRLTTETHPLSPNSNGSYPAHQSYYRSKSMANPPNPYHVKYATVLPTSAQDSELQSISSHSTNESMSCVGGHDGSDSGMYSLPHTKKQLSHTIKHNAKLNSANNMNAYQNRDLMTIMQSRTLKPLPASAQDASNPEKFAAKLIERLEKVKRELESEENNNKKLEEVLQLANTNTTNNKTNTTGNNTGNFRHLGTNTLDTSSSRLKEVLSKQKLEFSASEENDSQLILDRHCAQVFKTPNDTPDSQASINRCVSPPKHNFRPFYDSKGVTSSMSMTSNALNNSFDQSIVTVTVKFSTEQVPYKFNLNRPITLRKFKQHIPPKRGNWSYFFKRKCDEKERNYLNSSYVNEKVTEDNDLLPEIDGKIFAQLESL